MDKLKLTEEFFKRRFPEKDIEVEKKCGCFEKWVKRFESDNPETYMDDISLKVWREMNKSKLKTLKDFDWGKVIRCNDCDFSADELKREAIKWIKELEKMSEKANKNMQEEMENFSSAWNLRVDNQKLRDWIKHFFNITEDDLK